jgi:ABC-type Fe3+-hydroxamate transport system substrate-binding protein
MGTFLNCSAVAENQARDLESLISNFDNSDGWSRQFGKTFLYLIWRDPWMAVSKDTYISRFLELLGLSNIMKDENRYPIVTPEVIRSMAPDVVFMSSEPWPFRRRDADVWRELSGSPSNQNIFWIDGKALSWYGTLTLSALNEAKVGSKLTRRL